MDSIDEKRRLLGNYRGRRLMICRATDMISDIIDALWTDDGSLPESDGPRLDVSDAQKIMLKDLTETLRRMVILANDGQIVGRGTR